MEFQVDHLIICVEDLDDAGGVADSVGVESVAGGRHQGHGTANRILPLGGSYIEVLAVVDNLEATSSPFGLWATERSHGVPTIDAVCLGTDDIDQVCARLGLNPISMSRVKPDGSSLEWMVAGVAQMIDSSLPFFIQWDVPEGQHPGRGGAPGVGLGEVVIRGDQTVLTEWVGQALGVRLESGEPGITALVETADGVVEF